jgi:hypothetical membrane protein
LPGINQFNYLILSSFKGFGLAACGVIILAVFFTALRYEGKKHEAYSAMNHFISELGEVGVSKSAGVFNAGLIAGGILLLPFILGLGLYLGNTWAHLGILAGSWAALSCTFVGLFPMNKLTPHLRAAISYFRAGLVMVLLFTFAILARPEDRILIPKFADIFGILSVLTYAVFLFLLRKNDLADQDSTNLDPKTAPERPRFWLTAAMEWAVFFSTVLWFFSIALYI